MIFGALGVDFGDSLGCGLLGEEMFYIHNCGVLK